MLAQFLTKNSFHVRQAANSRQALHEANQEPIGTILMDHILNDEIDGIDLAGEIQRAHPHSTVIFVSGRDLTENDWRRIHQNRLRVGGRLPKPFDRQELLRLVEIAQHKRTALDLLQSAQERGFDPATYLYAMADLDSSLPGEVVDDLIQELIAEEAETGTSEDLSLRWDFGESPELRAVASEIAEIYTKLRTLVEARAGDPNLVAQAAPLRKRLRELQEIEADAMERRFREGRRFDPQKAQRNLEWAEKLLDEK